MKVPFLDLNEQYRSLSSELRPLIDQALESGCFVLGPNVEALEGEIASRAGSEFGVGVNSGTDALFLVLRALGIGRGDQVITTPFSFIAPAEVIRETGAEIVFADIDPETLNLNPACVAERVTDRTKAIIPVHLFGQPAAISELVAIAEPAGAAVVEDCAQAIGAAYEGRAVGGWGRAGCFSFYPTKNLGAFGDAGMVTTSDSELAEQLRLLRGHGVRRRYFHDIHGYNSRLDELQAVILRCKLKHLDHWNRRRCEIAEQYTAALRKLPIDLPVEKVGSTHVYHVYYVLTDRRDELQRHLADRGIGTLIYYPCPLHLQPVYRDLGWREGDYSVAESVSRRILPLPMFPELRDDQIGAVIDAVSSFPW